METSSNVILKVDESSLNVESPGQTAECENDTVNTGTTVIAGDQIEPSEDNGTDDQLKAETTQEVFVPESNELRQGYRILKELMTDGNKSVNYHFMDAVDIEATGLYDYYERVKTPMWLRKMKSKFESSEYATITQFVADFRLMLENCFRYNGPDHWVSKRGQRLETMLEQKLALLSRDLREKTSIAATSGKASDNESDGSVGLRRRGKNIPSYDSSVLLNQLRREEALREREQRKQQILERKAVQEAYVQEVINWENSLLEEPIRTQMKHLWELPQIGLFLFLCQAPLNIGEVVQHELERSFAMARESATLQAVMTTLLSTPYQRTRLDKKPMMPYNIWEEKLRARLNQWYKVLTDNNQDTLKTATVLGLDSYLFTVLGMKNPLDKRKFHELSFYMKIWIVKSLCDHCLASQDSLRDAIDEQPVEEDREYILGYDTHGNTYLHFPQFCGADLRVYRQAPIPHPKMDPIPVEPMEASEEPDASEVTPKKRKHNLRKTQPRSKKKRREKEKTVIPQIPSVRPSRLRQHIKPVLPVETAVSNTSDSDSDSEAVDSSIDESSTCSSVHSFSRYKSRLNGGMSSKDNTPEPPSFKGKIRKPRDFDARMNSYSPMVSSKEDTPEPDINPSKGKKLTKTRRQKSSRKGCVKSLQLDDGKPEIPFSNYGSPSKHSHSVCNETTGSTDCKDEQNINGNPEEVAENKECVNQVCSSKGNDTTDETELNKIKGDITDCDIKIKSESQLDSLYSEQITKYDKSRRVSESSRENCMDTEKNRPDDCNKDKETESSDTIKIENLSSSIKSENEILTDSPDNCELNAKECNIGEKCVEATELDSSIVCPPADATTLEATVENNKTDQNPELSDTKEEKMKVETTLNSSSTCDDAAAKTEAHNNLTDEKEVEDDDKDLPDIEPDLGSFELVADSVESLRKLTEQFAETIPVPEKGKRNKSTKPVARKKCIVELHERLVYLLKELEPWENKLTQATKRARMKLKKEKEEFDAEELKREVEDVWESEESDEESSDSEEEEEDTKTIPEIQIVTMIDNQPTTSDQLTSSRGRLRKRKIIPNNSEDTIKKRKPPVQSEILKPVPNILLRTQVSRPQNSLIHKHPISLIQQLKTPALNFSPNTVNTAQSASQMLMQANAISNGSSLPILCSDGKQVNLSHPAIQQLLAQSVKSGGQESYTVQIQVQPTSNSTIRSKTPAVAVTKVPPNINSPISEMSVQKTIAQTEGNKMGKLEIAKVGSTSVYPTPSGNKVKLVNKTQPFNKNLLSTLPPEVLQQLLKNQSIRIQTVSPKKETTVLSLASQDSKTIPSVTNISPDLSTSLSQPLSSVIASQDALKGQASLSPNKPKYACHVTVKTLLQDRAKKALEFQSEVAKDSDDSKEAAIVPSVAQVLSLASEVGQQLPAVLERSQAESQPIVVTVNTAIKGLPQTLKLPSKEALDSAVQAVVTSVKTTLPTAHLRVPAPSTMPSIHPRKNVTRTIQSMKSPIPVVNASMSGSQAISSATGLCFPATPNKNSSISSTPLTTLTASTGISQTAIKPNTGALPTNISNVLSKPLTGSVQANLALSKNKSILTPQTFRTPQGLVQGFLTPQGIVIPQASLQQSMSAKMPAANGSLESARLVTSVKANMPGKIVKPIDSACVTNKMNPVHSVCIDQTVASKPLVQLTNSQDTTPKSASKLLLQALNTQSVSVEEVPSKPSLLSGINVKVDSTNQQLAEPASQGLFYTVSPEISSVNQMGDGLQGKETPKVESQKPKTEKSRLNSEMPAAEVLLSLSQGLQSPVNSTSFLQQSIENGKSVCNQLSQPSTTTTSSQPQQCKSVQLSQPNTTSLSPQGKPNPASVNSQKLVLLNIGGKLYTSQGVPVTLDNGVLKIADTRSSVRPIQGGSKTIQISQPVVAPVVKSPPTSFFPHNQVLSKAAAGTPLLQNGQTVLQNTRVCTPIQVPVSPNGQPVVAKQLLSPSRPLIQHKPTVLLPTVLPPSSGSQPSVRIMGVNNQTLQLATNKTLVRMAVPNAVRIPSTQATAQAQSTAVLLGVGNPEFKHSGIVLSPSMKPSNPLVSGSKHVINSPTAIKFAPSLHNINQSITGQPAPVFLQVVSPGKSIQPQLSKILSPVQKSIPPSNTATTAMTTLFGTGNGGSTNSKHQF